MAKNTSNLNRISIEYFDGTNRAVSSNLAKKTELSHSTNARSVTIGAIEKRAGTTLLGSTLTATKNYKIFYFSNLNTPGFYRISTVSGVTTVYYLNDSDVWTALTGAGTKIYNLGDSTTQFDISNTSGTTYRYTYDTNGADPDIDAHLNVGSIVVIAAQNFSSVNNGTFTVTGVSTDYFEVTNASGSAETNKTIGTGSITITGNNFSAVSAENCMFLVNGDYDNMYLSADGTSVISATSATGHLYNSPKARKINYYKGKLYIADYTVVNTTTDHTRYKNSVMMSSEPVGIVALVNLDYANADCGADDWIEVTDTKYIHSTDTLDIYRGNNKIADVTVKAKTESSIQINAISFAGSYDTLEASDEVWVDGTYNGTRKFRWAGNPASGNTVKQYDTFTLSGGQNERIKMFTNINDYMIIGNNSNLTYWNGSSLKNLDLGIGCVSDNGYVKTSSGIFFMHYTGIYSTAGYEIPTLISSPVQPYFDGATKAGLEAGAMGYKGTSVFCAIGDVTLYNPDGSVSENLTDVVLEKNLRQSNWSIHTGISATEFATYDASSGVDKLEYASEETGYKIFELFSGETDDSTGDAKEIPFHIRTQDLTLSKEFEKICYPHSVIVEVERGSGINLFVSLDGEPFYQLKGQANKGCSIIKINGKNDDKATPPRCRKIRVALKDYSKALCKISRIAIIYANSMEEENQRN